MFLFNAVRRWWTEVWDIHQEMMSKESGVDPFSAESYTLMWRTSVVMYVAPIPPLARYLQRKLIS